MSLSSPSNAAAATNKNIDADIVLETIVSGLHWSVLHIGTIATLANACFQRKADWTLWPSRHLVRDNSKMMQAPLRYCADIGLTAEIGGDLTRLYERLSEVKARTNPLMTSASSYTSSEHQLLGQVQVKWRQLCLNAMHIMHDLKPEVKQRLVPQYSEDGQALVSFLMEAASGNTKRVSAQGEISPPTLRQRRHTPRVQLQLPCRLALPGLTLPATLFDVSQEGVGVICNHPLLDRQAVSVELNDGRVLKAIVVRRDGDRNGLLLSRPLASGDPLFRRALGAAG
jgi:hypothetical protein